MTKRGIVAAAALAFAVVVASGVSHAKTVATVEEALALTFGEGVTITPKEYELSAETLLRLEEEHRHVLLTTAEKEAWGCPLAEDYEETMVALEAAEYQPTTVFLFFHASKDGEDLGTAVVVDAPGKWGMVDYLVGLDSEGAVTHVEILKHGERRGKGIERQTFLTQFEGMTAETEVEIGENVTAVSGATVSSRSACAAVTKAVVLCKEFCLKDAPMEEVEPAEETPAETDAPVDTEPPVEDTAE
jgi:Na+-translocating ferredoxin:NAD+ oxidoreductase RnfG subunit